ncbi:MAG: hypothetical protein QOI01_4381 [Mycobacterium sp.]|jgi:hypothetical protein|nr:hypothetical protein [Mycobacterium sp.]
MPPIGHQLNVTTQAILTYGSWTLTAVILIVSVRMGRREGTPFYVLMVLAAMVGALVEPLYDVAMMLYFYSTAGMWTHFTAFDIPQPVWTHSGYVVLYASTAPFIAREIARGTLTRQRLFGWAAVELAMSAAFEIFGINAGAYSYWGPHVFRIFQYPLVIGVLEAAQVICFAVAASQLRARVTHRWQLLGLFVLFPCTFLLANFGAGWPVVIAMHLQHTTPLLVAGATVISIGFAAVLVWAAGAFLSPPSPAADAEGGSRGVAEQYPQPSLG